MKWMCNYYDVMKQIETVPSNIYYHKMEYTASSNSGEFNTASPTCELCFKVYGFIYINNGIIYAWIIIAPHWKPW